MTTSNGIASPPPWACEQNRERNRGTTRKEESEQTEEKTQHKESEPVREVKVVGLITEGKELMRGLSPMCTALSRTQAIDKDRRYPREMRDELDEANDHVRWVAKLCARQARARRDIVFEHPVSAINWQMSEIKTPRPERE